MSRRKPKTESVILQPVRSPSTPNMIPCSLEEIEAQLRMFITAFILPEAQLRWRNFLIDKRPQWDRFPRSGPDNKIWRKADEVLNSFARDRQNCAELPGQERRIARYGATFGNASGIYFDLATPPCRMTPLEVEQLFSWKDNSGILFFEAGKKALYFLHGGSVWICEINP